MRSVREVQTGFDRKSVVFLGVIYLEEGKFMRLKKFFALIFTTVFIICYDKIIQCGKTRVLFLL